MFRRFGSEVTVVEMGPRLIAREDEDSRDAVARHPRSRRHRLRLDAEVHHARRSAATGSPSGVDCAERRARDRRLASAACRRPPAEHRRPRPRQGRCRDRRARLHRGRRPAGTNVPGIWALGDCNGRGAFTHTSYNDFEIVAANLLDNDPRRVSDRIPAYALYIDPPLGRAGLTEAEVRKAGRPRARSAKRPMTRCQPRRRERRDTGLHEDPGRRRHASRSSAPRSWALGGDEVIHSILDLMYAKAPYTVMQRAVHIHPTVSELLPTMLGELRSSE